MTPKQYKNLAERMHGEYVKRMCKIELALPYLRIWGDALAMYDVSMRNEIRKLEKEIFGGN
jgi:hypothetical protein